MLPKSIVRINRNHEKNYRIVSIQFKQILHHSNSYILTDYENGWGVDFVQDPKVCSCQPLMAR